MRVTFRLNGRAVEEDVSPAVTLLDFLRDRLQLSSVKKGCDEGKCGACTVLLDGKPVCTCLLLAPQVQGSELTTVEGLSQGGRLSPIQAAFLDRNGYQCGFCTPGMILSAKALLDGNASPTIDEIKDALEGNLCRCTGYQQIIESVQQAAQTLRESRR